MNNSWFSIQVGFAHRDLKEIDSFFSKSEGDLCHRLKSNIKEKIERIIHYLRTGVWINFQVVGQTLNEYRFQDGVSKEQVEAIELIMREKLGDDFLSCAYQSAEKETPWQWAQNSAQFFMEFVKSPTTVGSILPSSKKLARGIAREITIEANTDTPKRILEVGPGTGIFTKRLIKSLGENDQLDLVEFDEKFVKVLQRRFGHHENINIIQGDFTTFKADDQYDYCISGLPLAAFSEDLVTRVYETFNKVVKKDGKIIYFEYMGIPKIKKQFLRGEKREAFQTILKIKNKYYEEHEGNREKIWMNVTPAYVCSVTV